MVNEQSLTTSLLNCERAVALADVVRDDLAGLDRGPDQIGFLHRSAANLSSQPQPWRHALTERAQQLARDKAGDANRDHADDDLLVRAADIGVPDEEPEAAAAGAA